MIYTGILQAAWQRPPTRLGHIRAGARTRRGLDIVRRAIALSDRQQAKLANGGGTGVNVQLFMSADHSPVVRVRQISIRCRFVAVQQGGLIRWRRLAISGKRMHMLAQEYTLRRSSGATSGRLPPRADEKLTGQRRPELEGEQLSFFHAIEQFSILKSFQHDLYLLTGLPFDLVDLRMRSSEKLKAHRLFTAFCALVNSTPQGRLACESDDQKAASSCLQGGECLSRRCHLGLIDITIPIVVNRRAVGLLCTGQLLYHRPTPQAFRRIQRRLAGLGVDEAKARQAYFKLPVLEKRRVKAIIDLMQMVAELIGNQRLQMLKTVVLHHPLSKALDFIEARYAEPLTLPTVAKAAGLSVSRLAHVFKAQIGMSVTAYLNMVRVQWARYYLTSSSLRISETAFEVGFGNLSHFNHVFRRATGLSPTQYRRQHTSTKE
jgi:AraC-like DNA-binding protein